MTSAPLVPKPVPLVPAAKCAWALKTKNADFPEHLNRKSQATELPDLYIVFS